MEQDIDIEARAIEEERLKWEAHVKDGALSTLSIMGAMRKDCIENKNVSEDSKKRYAHLASNFASNLREMASLNPNHNKTSSKIKVISESLNKDKSLFSYDPLQGNTLKESHPDVMRALNEILISIVEDKFVSTKDNYHILQAVKIFSEEDDTKYRRAMRVSISPMQVDLEVKNDALWKRFGAFFLGETYNIEKIDEFTLKIKNDITLDSLDALISKLGGKGYNALRVDVSLKGKEKDIFFERYPRAKRTNTEDMYPRRGRDATLEFEIPLGSFNENDTVDILRSFDDFRQKYSENLSDYVSRTTLGSIAEYFGTTRFYNINDVSINNCHTHVFPNNQDGIAFSNIKKIDDFTKYSVLMYKNTGKKLDEYLLTAIISQYKSSDGTVNNSNNDDDDRFCINWSGIKLGNDGVISKIIETLISKDDTALKLETLADELAPNYIRLRKFNGNTLVKDYGGVGWYD